MSPLPPIREEAVIERGRDHVWRILTQRTPDWLGCMRYEAKVAHVFYMQQDRAKAAANDIAGATHCEILALDAPRLFKFSWFMPGTPATEVSFALEPIGKAQTRAVVLHEGWDKFPADQIKPIRDMLDGGWRSFVVPNLKRVAEA